MLNNIRLIKGTVLCAAAMLAASPVPLQAKANAVPVSTAERDDLHRALDEARIGNLVPIDALLTHGKPAGTERALLEAQKAAALLREQEASEALQRYFAAGDRDEARRARAHGIAAETAFFSERYSEAAHHAGQFLAAPAGRDAHEIEGMERLKQIAELLSGAPRQQLASAGTGEPAAIARDRVGLIRTKIRSGAAEEEAVIDTGANLSVASASAARRMGLTMIEGDAAVGNSLGDGVDVRLAMADRLELAGAVLRNVVFLVMDDEALTFPVPGGYSIDAIVGLPALRALGRLRFGPGDTLRIESERSDEPGPQNLRLIGSSPYVVMTIEGREHPLFFDSGANDTSLSLRFVAEHPELEVSDAGEARRAGAGGVELVRQNRIEDVSLGVGETQANLAAVDVEIEPAPGDEDRYGVVGADLMRTFDSVIIDFNRMSVEVQLGT